MRRSFGHAAIGLLVCAGCAVGPNYERPPLLVPDTTRGEARPADAASLADLPWWEVFSDPVLQRLVEEAIAHNHDLAAATARVEQARNLVAVARSGFFPQVGYEGDASRQRRLLGTSGDAGPTFNSFLATFNLAWEIDVWGRIRRATESARADYLAADHARRGVLLTLVSDVALAWFDLLELDRSLAITRRSAETFRGTADLFNRRFTGGIGTMLEVSRARAALAQAEADVPEFERRIVVKENQLSVLMGRTPGGVERGAALAAQPLAPEVPVGLPSQLLERRPDIMQAEQLVVAANAEVGVAVANFFPRIGLTTLYGGQSAELENLVKSGANVWAIGGSLAGPIFQGGRLLAGKRAASARREEAAERFLQATLQAFAEVSDALVSHEKLKTVRLQREEAVTQLETSVSLSLQRYKDGIANYLDVLEAQQNYFPAELALARTQRDELVAVVSLYRALGGGWKKYEDETPDSHGRTSSNE